eukprot:UC1_evm1s663
MASAHDRRIRELEEELRRLKEELALALRARDQTKTALDQSISEAGSLTEALEKARALQKTTAAERDAEREHVTELEAALRTARNEAADAAAEGERLGAESDRLRAEVARLNETLDAQGDGLRGQLVEARKAREQVEDQLAEAGHAAKRQGARLTAAEEEGEELRRKLQKAADDLEAARAAGDAADRERAARYKNELDAAGDRESNLEA